VPTEILILAYVVVCLGLLSAVAFYYERRRRRFEPAFSADSVFRCRKCGFVYTDDPDVARSRCPQCGRSNEVFQF
jgi:rubrerythrin